jgi:enamine deaminase RidA (YjgF/YER057c/UK114 family)
MITRHNPEGFSEPAAYSHGIAVPATARTLYVSGQIAIDSEGQTPADFAKQAELVFANVKAVLKAGGMSIANVIKMNTYLTRPSDYSEFVKTRTAVMDGNKPTSTLVYVSALAKPDLLVEVEVVAAAE